MASEVAEESISVVPDHLYEIPSSALEHVVLRESECCESALRMEENESSALEEHVVLKEKECHGSALRMEENECYGSSALEHVVLKENECYGSALKMEENECYGSSALEEHVVLNENECYGSAFKMKENDCYESLQLKVSTHFITIFIVVHAAISKVQQKKFYHRMPSPQRKTDA